MANTDPQYWRHRAEEAKRNAEEATDPEDKKTLVEIAVLYQELANRYEQLKRK
jgi:hypothetical protein